MLTIVIPMAGAGSRFSKEGYTLPKPFIDVNGRMMIERVLDGLSIVNARYILVIQQKFLDQNAEYLSIISSKYPVTYVTVNQLTQGACCSALAAYKQISLDHPVLFADSDNIFNNQVVKKFIEYIKVHKFDGALLTFKSSEPCFSYAEINKNGLVIRTKEKDVISAHAIAGVYFFSKGEYFIDNAIEMIIYGDKEKNEFYMSNVYNYAIRKGLKIGIFDINQDDWHCVGTPIKLKEYLAMGDKKK